MHIHLHAEHNTIKTRDTVLKKNISLTLFERVVCERELATEQNCNILTPHSYGHQRFFPVLLGWSTGDLGAQPLWCWFSLPHLISNSSDLQTDWISCALSYIIVQCPPSSCGHSFNLSTVKVIISWYFSTGCTCYLLWCISYFDRPAGS